MQVKRQITKFTNLDEFKKGIYKKIDEQRRLSIKNKMIVNIKEIMEDSKEGIGQDDDENDDDDNSLSGERHLEDDKKV